MRVPYPGRRKETGILIQASPEQSLRLTDLPSRAVRLLENLQQALICASLNWLA